ncbi:MAG: phosphoribosyltransferase [Candidatus Methanoperedens sp.]|nr:phosphoribosyltransferase [Candidatus Methanoperedens sp.]
MEKPGNKFKCHLVSWDESHRLAKILASKIKSSGFKADLVIGIARGGLVPARVVCDYLLQKDLAAIKVEHWGIAATLGKAKIKFPLPIDISGKKILVVDDVADTGDTFSVIRDYLKEKNPSEVKTAVLHYKTCSTSVPDYWAEMQEKWMWIIYPWAVYEDLTGFVKKVLVKPMTHEKIRKSLKNNYGIKISRKDLSEILNDMQAAGDLRKMKKGIYVESG